MGKVTSVESQKKNSKRFNIFIDGEFAFGADEDLVVDRRLIIGKEIDKENLEKLLFESEVGKLIEKMYRLFNVRARSEKEVRNYLKRLSFKRKIKDQEEISDSAVGLLIKKLEQKGFISDIQFAKDWVSARSKKKGKIVIKGELLQKGISKEIIEQVLEGISDNQKVIEDLLLKKIKIWKNLPSQDFRKKAHAYLLRKGFKYETIKSIVEKFLQKR